MSLHRTVLAGAAVLAGLVLASGAATASADSAIAPPTGNEGYATTCFGAHACIELGASGAYRSGILDAAGYLQPAADSARVADLHIDRLVVTRGGTVVSQTNGAYKGGRARVEQRIHKVQTPPAGCAPWRARLYVDVTLTDRSVHTASVLSEYYVPGLSTCTADPVQSSSRVRCTSPAGHDCLHDDLGVARSADHRTVYAWAQSVFGDAQTHGSIGANRSGLTSFRIDDVQLIRGATVVSHAPAADSGPVPPQEVNVLALSGAASTGGCADYRARMYYSQRFGNGTVQHGVWTSPVTQVC